MEAGDTSEPSSESCRKKGKITIIFLTEYDEEAIIDFCEGPAGTV